MATHNVINTNKIVTGADVTYSGAFASTFTLTGITTVTFPTSGTLATTSQIPSLPLSLANGGTNANLTASNGGVFYSTGTAGAILSGTATANQVLLSGSSTTPAWSTATYPATTTINQLLYSSSANTIAGLTSANNGAVVTGSTGIPSVLAGPGTTGNIFQSNTSAAPSFSTATYPSTATSTGTVLRANGTNWVASTSTFADTYSASTLLYSNGANTVTGLATANSAALVTNSTGVPTWSGTMTNGQVIVGSTGATPTAATLTQGTGITITNGAGSITIAATGGGGLTWNDVAGTTQAAAVNNAYITSNASQTTVTLPATAAVGTVFGVQGKGAAGWILQANTGQVINFGSSASTSAGSLTSTNQWDSVQIVCVTANTTFAVTSSVGNLTVA